MSKPGSANGSFFGNLIYTGIRQAIAESKGNDSSTTSWALV
jgi:hypothetical protein